MSAQRPCGVEWCTWNDCRGDHWSSPGENRWPNVEATSYSADGRQYATPAPTRCEMDGLSPAVLVWLQRISSDNVAVLDETFEFTPDEARQLAARLVAAADAAETSVGARQVQEALR